MDVEEYQRTIDTLRRDEDVLREMARQAAAAEDDARAAQFRRIYRDLFEVRQCLEYQWTVLNRMMKGSAE